MFLTSESIFRISSHAVARTYFQLPSFLPI